MLRSSTHTITAALKNRPIGSKDRTLDIIWWFNVTNSILMILLKFILKMNKVLSKAFDDFLIAPYCYSNSAPY